MQLDLNGMTVDYKALGFDGTINLVDLPESTIKAALIYGTRRMIQDSCNSEAFKLRKERELDKDAELPESDRKTIHDARIGAMKAGTIGVRTARQTSGLSAELSRFMQEYRQVVKANAKVKEKEYKDATPQERDAMLAKWLLAQTEKHEAWTAEGKRLLDADKEKAELAKGLF